MKISLINLLVLSLCMACSPDKGKSDTSEKPAGVVTEAQKETLEKAKQTDEMVKEATEQRMKEAE